MTRTGDSRSTIGLGGDAGANRYSKGCFGDKDLKKWWPEVESNHRHADFQNE